MIITTTHTKGGVGKSTLTILTAKTLAAANYKVLVIDLDYQNNSTSYYFNESVDMDLLYQKNIFNVFAGQPIEDNIIKVSENIDFINSDIRLNEFRNTEYLKLRKIIKNVKDKYDYILIDTTPGYDNLVANTYYISDKLIIPTLIDTYHYQAMHFILDKIKEHELNDLNVSIVLNQYQKPAQNLKEESYKVQINHLFMNDEKFNQYYLDSKVLKSDYIKQYIDNKDFKIKNSGNTKNIFENIVSFVSEVIEKPVKIEVI